MLNTLNLTSNETTTVNAITVEAAIPLLIDETLTYMSKAQPRTDAADGVYQQDKFNQHIATLLINAEDATDMLTHLVGLAVERVNAARQSPTGSQQTVVDGVTMQSDVDKAIQGMELTLGFMKNYARSLTNNAFFMTRSAARNISRGNRTKHNDESMNHVLEMLVSRDAETLEQRAEYAGSNPKYAEAEIWQEAAEFIIEDAPEARNTDDEGAIRATYNALMNTDYVSAYFRRGEFNVWNVGGQKVEGSDHYDNAISVQERFEQLLLSEKQRAVRHDGGDIGENMAAILAEMEQNPISGNA